MGSDDTEVVYFRTIQESRIVPNEAIIADSAAVDYNAVADNVVVAELRAGVRLAYRKRHQVSQDLQGVDSIYVAIAANIPVHKLSGLDSVGDWFAARQLAANHHCFIWRLPSPGTAC